jgi:2-dehydro-3-deoxygluconokinase
MTTLGSAGEATDVVTLGETMALMRADSPGPLQHVSTLSMGMGGSETNFAIALRRLGTSVTWVGRVGVDSLGDHILRELAAEQIATAAVRDPAVWYYRAGSAGSRLSPHDLPEDAIRRARLLHITGITPGLSASAAAAVDRAIDCAREAGTLVAFDLNYRAALWTPDAAGEAFRKLAARADLVFAGDDEAALAVGRADDPKELARRLAELGPTQVIIKLGAEGAVALVDGVEYVQPAIRVETVDTVGAGDGFVAGYVSDLLAGAGVQQRLRTAAQVGAFACLVPGDWEGMPRRSELGILEATEPVSR